MLVVPDFGDYVNKCFVWGEEMRFIADRFTGNYETLCELSSCPLATLLTHDLSIFLSYPLTLHVKGRFPCLIYSLERFVCPLRLSLSSRSLLYSDRRLLDCLL